MDWCQEGMRPRLAAATLMVTSALHPRAQETLKPNVKANVKAAGIDRRLCAASLVCQCLRLSFMRSPGVISEAPLACPTVPFSRMRLPGLFSEAPGAVVVVEFCISCPGLYCEAPGDAAVPALFVVCATANEAVPKSSAVAIAIVFDILISLGWSPGGNR